jgi:16S rRNA (cytosine967-C5)-methyltransferase
VAHAERGYFVAAEGWNDAIERLVGSGVLSPQDPTAGKAVRMAAEILPNAKRVADLCAGMGTKAMQMARAWHHVEVAASDIDMLKLERLSERAAIMGATNVKTFPPKHLAGTFDVVLADVPCSNTGVMARRVQSRWRWPKLEMDPLLRVQREILERAASLISPGGAVVYSTCSLDPRENQKRVDGFVQRNAGWKKVKESVTLPSSTDEITQSHDGGYVAILQR